MAKFCKECGLSINEDTVICPNCGTRINGSNNDNSSSTGNSNTNGNVNSKNRVMAGLLGIFLGAFGVHNFYLGYTNKGIAQLLMTLLSCGMLGVVSEIWGIIEGIMILTNNMSVDAYGNPLV